MQEVLAPAAAALTAQLPAPIVARRSIRRPPFLLHSQFLERDAAAAIFRQLLEEQRWPENHYEVFGRRFTLPRLQAWHADAGIVYSYSDNLLQARPWIASVSLGTQRDSASGARTIRRQTALWNCPEAACC